jgi:Mrp family chromosome partitioning ATPase
MNTNSSDEALDLKPALGPLVHRLNATLAWAKGAVVTFISAHGGEGTTTVARAFAAALHNETGKRVLLIANECAAPGIVETVASGQDVADALSETEAGFSCGTWASNDDGRAQSGKLVMDKMFWKSLKSMFDVIIIDAPALGNANEGVAYAQASNATVLVVEAEGTRKQVVENLRNTLESAGAKIAGVVLNKRKFYIPAKMYKRL